MRKSLDRIVSILFNLLIINPLVSFIYKVKVRYICPRVDKVIGANAVKRIRNKGKDLRIHGQIVINDINKLQIGDFVRIGTGAYLSCEGCLTIGNNVQISRNVLIFTSNHDINSSAIPYDQGFVYKPVKIGNSVWIGMNVTIAPGSTIEDGAVIGMGTVISGVVPKGAIVVGAKHRVIGYRNMADFNEKDMEKKYFGLLFPDS